MIRLLGCAFLVAMVGCDSGPTAWESPYKSIPGWTPDCTPNIVAVERPRRGMQALDTIPCGRPPRQ